ncbi:MAG: ZIP family metal transporter [Clostridia bacterium]|nr:ZIP family metal transporter [Clostridia bacterium]
MNILTIIVFSSVAGIVGTGIGGLIGVFLGERTMRTVSLVLTFASGVMISVALFDLMPEASQISGPYITAAGVLIGVLTIYGFNYWIDKATQRVRSKVKTHDTLPSLYHQEDLIIKKTSSKKLLRAGFIMLLAISLHNIPEGLAIGTSGAVSINLSITLAILLALHNVPEGMAMAVPLTAGGIGKIKTLILVIFAGATTIIGGALGILLGSVGDTVIALSLSFAAGAMLYVTFCEILPQSVLMEKGRMPAMFSILGILVGFIITSVI